MGRACQNCSSSSVIWATRRAWRPPSNDGRQEHREDLLGEPDADDAGADRQHVGVVVGPRQAGRVQVVAERGPHAAHLVGGELLALAAAADHDAEVGVAVAHAAPDGGAERRVVDGLGRVGAVVDDLVALGRQHRDEVLLQLESGVVGAERDACHDARVYEGGRDSTRPPSCLLQVGPWLRLKQTARGCRSRPAR